MTFDNITDVPHVKVGNMQNMQALTGCTVVILEKGAVCGVDVRGSAPGTRETDLLDPINLIDNVHAICLAGGSAFGLDAVSGVMQYLEEQERGLDVGVATVPIVPGAVLFDLPIGDPKVRPDRQMGYEAAKQAISGPFALGNVGAGCGATVGKLAGFDACMKGGLGSASITLANGLTVGALVAVNAVGDIRDPKTHEILAGPISKETGEVIDSLEYLKTQTESSILPGMNTTIGVVAVNAALTKAEAKKVAQVTQNAYARTIFPVHTMLDGDTVFAVGTGTERFPVDLIANVAAEAMEIAIIRAIKEADSVEGAPAYKDRKK